MNQIVNHLWQSTLFAAAAAIVALALRRNYAQVRYRVWLAASVKFVIPFSLLLSAGGRLPVRVTQSVAPPYRQAALHFAEPVASMPAPLPSRPGFQAAAMVGGLWFAGFAVVAMRRWKGWLRIRLAVQASSALPIAAPVEVRSAPGRIEPGIFGLIRPVVLLPQGIEDRLAPAQLQAILAHEFCHLRRRDHLAAAFHMVVEALFWFHPAVWWIGARLIEERERACDEEVLRSGSDPETYAAGILAVCRFYLESPLACAPGVTGADLKKRIQAVMTRPVLMNLTSTRRAALSVVAAAVVAIPIGIGTLQAQNRPSLRFEVASIKPIRAEGSRGLVQFLPGGQLRMSGTIKSFVSMAYGVLEDRISGDPAWLSRDVYQIDAKPERPDDAASANPAPGTPSWERMGQRLQSLLAERCRLVVHKESKITQGYALVLSKGGFKLKPAENAEDIPPGTVRSHGEINGRAAPLTMLTHVLSNWLQRPVEDRTGLTGRYTYKLTYRPDDAAGDAEPGPSVYTALQEQLGLKLEPARVTIQNIVIDRVEKPSVN